MQLKETPNFQNGSQLLELIKAKQDQQNLINLTRASIMPHKQSIITKWLKALLP